MVQDELLIEQLNQKQVGAFKILFDRTTVQRNFLRHDLN